MIYPEVNGDWQNRVIAIQLRFLVPHDDDTSDLSKSVLTKIGEYNTKTRAEFKVSKIENRIFVLVIDVI